MKSCEQRIVNAADLWDIFGDFGTVDGPAIAMEGGCAATSRGLRVETTEKIGAAGVHRRRTVVRRGVEGGRTVTTISPGEGDARVQEIARMLGGAGITTVALDHARQMLDRTAKRGK